MQSDAPESEPMGDDEFVDSLRSHAEGMGQRSVSLLAGTLTVDNLPDFLETCLRLPTEIQYDETGLSEHQFAEPEFLERAGRRICVLHVRPKYKSFPDALPAIVAYMAAAINYGASASPDLCERFGAILLGTTVDDFYDEICRIADFNP